MPTTIHFSKSDIGGEILPILTTGLYRDTLDALREYIQNSIDANAASVSVRIDPSTIVITDDGTGMNPVTARRAIRLGISDKNPNKNVGFRGIGIYSAFNLCNLLEIYTKIKGARIGSRIVFQFGEIRTQLLAEQERRKQGRPPQLFLEQLLESNVFVEDDTEKVMTEHGTRVILSDVLSDCYLPLQDWDTVANYMQDVVPLPFDPQFRYGASVAKKFAEEDYRVIPLELSIADRRESLYRPYRDDQFDVNGKYRPHFVQLKSGNERFGFAWVCINGRHVFKKEHQKIRGLLIKKFGFSIGNRSFLEPYFKRTVFNRRITGEIIIQHEGLLPNAARSDFENNSARQRFLQTIPTFIADLSTWANTIQQDEKAREVLEEVHEELQQLADTLPEIKRDKDAILKANVDLADYEHRLHTHRKMLDKMSDVATMLASARSLLRSSKALVKDALTMSAAASKRLERDVVKVMQSETKSKQVTANRRVHERPKDLVTALEACGIVLSDDAQQGIRHFESEFLLEHFDKATYSKLLSQFIESLEQRI